MWGLLFDFSGELTGVIASKLAPTGFDVGHIMSEHRKPRVGASLLAMATSQTHPAKSLPGIQNPLT
jgi:hypothetical protein